MHILKKIRLFLWAGDASQCLSTPRGAAGLRGLEEGVLPLLAGLLAVAIPHQLQPLLLLPLLLLLDELQTELAGIGAGRAFFPQWPQWDQMKAGHE